MISLFGKKKRYIYIEIFIYLHIPMHLLIYLPPSHYKDSGFFKAFYINVCLIAELLTSFLIQSFLWYNTEQNRETHRHQLTSVWVWLITCFSAKFKYQQRGFLLFWPHPKTAILTRDWTLRTIFSSEETIFASA